MRRKILLFLIAFSLAGCATIVRYTAYTGQVFPRKPGHYFITIYPSLPPFVVPSFQAIGKIEVSGYASEGVSPDVLAEKAKIIARQKGADAVINAKTEGVVFSGVDVVPGHFTRYHYHDAQYIPYSDTLFTFQGELIVFINET
jgi:hypothetical protein